MLKVILISWPWTTSETWLKMNTVSFIWACEATFPLRPSKVALHIWNLATWRFHLKLIGERRVTSQVLKIKVCFFKLQNKVLSTDLLLFTVGYSIMTRAAVAALGTRLRRRLVFWLVFKERARGTREGERRNPPKASISPFAHARVSSNFPKPAPATQGIIILIHGLILFLLTCPSNMIITVDMYSSVS